MDGRFINHNHRHQHFLVDQEYPINLSGNPRPPTDKMNSTTSPSKKSSKRSVQKRVVSIPIGDVDGSRTKGEVPPPSDSWAWRKYGQKPIKGSPYPRGYYRCSSSKGCPARKQVERSRSDPTMLVITYACEHNHIWSISRNAKNSAAHLPKSYPERPAVFSGQPEIQPEEKFADMESDAALLAEEFLWFSDVASSPNVDSLLQSPICTGSSGGEDDLEAVMLTMGEEDESLFADLGELPECSVVFRRRFFGDEESGRCSLGPAPLCGSTG